MMMGLGDAKRPWMYNVETGEVTVRHRPCPSLPLRQLEEELEGLRLLLDYESVDPDSLSAGEEAQPLSILPQEDQTEYL